MTVSNRFVIIASNTVGRCCYMNKRNRKKLRKFKTAITSEQNQRIASTIDLSHLFKNNEYTMTPNDQGLFKLKESDPNYKRWIEE